MCLENSGTWGFVHSLVEGRKGSEGLKRSEGLSEGLERRSVPSILRSSLAGSQALHYPWCIGDMDPAAHSDLARREQMR